jgi:hypothetical protein
MSRHVWTVFVNQTSSVSHQTNVVGPTNVQIVLSAPLILIVVLHIIAAIHVRMVVIKCNPTCMHGRDLPTLFRLWGS